MTGSTGVGVGRIVHYVSRGSKDGAFESCCRAAFITEIGDPGGTIGLCAVNPTGLFFHSIADGGCSYDEGHIAPGGELEGRRVYRGGSWHWPERL